MRAASSECPICRKGARPRGENASFPFCGPRCKQIDLGQWLDEKYRMPTEESPEGEAPSPEDEPK